MTRIASPFTSLFWTFLLTSLLALILWWLIRRRLREIKFPLVKILEIAPIKLPRMIIKMPPLIPFFTFLVCVFAFGFWLLKPTNLEFTNHEPKDLRTHLFVDMSPSVSSKTDQIKLAERIKNVWGTLGKATRITLSTSHNDTIYEIRDAAQAQTILQGLNFHRAGVRIGNALKQHLSQTGEIDRLLIASDRDQHSWSGFQWRYLSEDMEVYLVKVTDDQDSLNSPNPFINGVKKVSSPQSLGVEWEIEIAQGGLQKAQQGTLKAIWQEEILASTAWKIAENSRSTLVHLGWPASKLADNTSLQPIKWEITPQGSDAIMLDNIFFSSASGQGGKAKIIAEPSGELPLEDPASNLLSVLKVLGLEAYRIDHADLPSKTSDRKSHSESDTTANQIELLVLMGGLDRQLSTFCPVENARQIWIAPWDENANLQEICHCLTKQLGQEDLNSCSKVDSRKSWVNWLAESGGRQIGGGIGENDSAVAFEFKPQSSKKNANGFNQNQSKTILAMTLPLKPSSVFGVSHGRFPILIRELLNVNKNIGTSENNISFIEDWPRFSDTTNTEPTNTIQIDQSNVPMAESLLDFEPLKDLPPVWNESSSLDNRKNQGKLDAENPLPWIKFMAFTALFAVLVEVVWGLNHLKKKTLTSSLIFFLLFWFENKSFAQIQFNFIDPSAASSTSRVFNNLSKEVASRTSISMDGKPLSSNKVSSALMSEGWIWTQDLRNILNPKQELNAELVQWIKRGGFLVIEQNSIDEDSLQRLVAPFQKGSFQALNWRPVPQDHELMRSFYLLETLPVCNKGIWKWYPIDGRLGILYIPYHFSKTLQDAAEKSTCENSVTQESQTRVFINILMVALTTDYKKDQIHLPEILKRLRNP